MSSSQDGSGEKPPDYAAQFEAAVSKALSYDVSFLNSGVESKVEEAVAAWVACRKIVCHRDMDNDQMLRAALLPQTEKLLALVHVCKADAVSVQLLWTISNLLSGDTRSITHLASLGVADCIQTALRSEYIILFIQGLWAMSNLAGDSAHSRDLLLRAGVVESVVAFHGRKLERESQRATETSRESSEYREYYTNLTWSLRGLLSGDPLPAIDVVAPLFPLIRSVFLEQCLLADAKVIESISETKRDDQSWQDYLSLSNYPHVDPIRFADDMGGTFADFLWCFSLFAEHGVFAKKIVKDIPLLRALCTTLISAPHATSRPIVGTLGSIAREGSAAAQAATDCGALFALGELLIFSAYRSPASALLRPKTVREALWTLSNYIADIDANAGYVSKNIELRAAILEVNRFDPQTEVPQEVFILTANMISHPSGVPSDLDRFYGTVDSLTEILDRMASMLDKPKERIAYVLPHAVCLASLYEELSSAHPAHACFADVDLWASFAVYGKEIPMSPMVDRSLSSIRTLMKTFLTTKTNTLLEEDFEARFEATEKRIRDLLAAERPGAERKGAGAEGQSTERAVDGQDNEKVESAVAQPEPAAASAGTEKNGGPEPAVAGGS